jgi:FkbM family methyltransferase
MKLRKAFRHLLEHLGRFGPANAMHILYLKKRPSGGEAVLRMPELAGPLAVRTGTSDLAIFDEVVMQRGYAFGLPSPPEIIVDAGANIGMASLWFKKAYPSATIIAVEPDAGNYELLVRNTKNISGIVPVQAAISPMDGELAVDRQGARASSFTTRAPLPDEEAVRAISIPTLMKEHGLDRIGLLKIDIEGAEKELFEAQDLAWLDRVDTIAIELHDRMKPGCGHAFFKASSRTPRNYAVHGQLVVATRRV